MKLNYLFCDNMVLQAGKPITFFGEGEGTGSVSFCGVTYQISCNNGSWSVMLPAMNYGGPFDFTVTLDNEVITIKNVMIGEVVLLSGQSNLQYKLDAELEAPPMDADNSLIRVFAVDRLEEGEPYKSLDGWVICKKDTCMGFSAVGYHVADLLNKRLGVAVGVIACYQGASIIQTWIKPEISTKKCFFVEKYERFSDHDEPMYQTWNRDGILYNNMFKKIVPFTIGNVIWYQGESNTALGKVKVYKQLLENLIMSWREDEHDSSLPFLVIQLCDLDNRDDDAWHGIQKIQEEVGKELPMVTTVVARDVCETNDIHPKTKSVLSARIVDVIIKNCADRTENLKYSRYYQDLLK